MLFNSLQFLIFFPIVLLFYFILPKILKNYWLLAASYFFYMGWNPKYALLLLFCTAVSYSVAIFIEKLSSTADSKNATNNTPPTSTPGKKAACVLVCAVAIILCLLFYYKYLNVAFSILNKLFSAAHIQVRLPKCSIVLPVGISFFSFQAIGYIIDVYRKEIPAERNFFRYALFVSFFPQLVAGPIERSKNLLTQLSRTYSFNFERAKSGFLTMLWGYFLKVVIADRAALLVDFVFSNKNATGAQIVFATVIFAFQIYCDFCGYSTIAVGAARILGFNLTPNFNTPYFAVSTKDFWRRWHISLSSWFKDYLYIPLGGSHCSRLRKNLNVLIVMTISGIWHGAGIHFILWGFLNGVFQIFDDITSTVRKKIPKPVQICLTFVAICASWLVFRANNLRHLRFLVSRILHNFSALSVISDYKLGKNGLTCLLCSICVLLAVDFLRYKRISLKNIALRQHYLIQTFTVAAAICAILLFGIWGPSYNPSAFIYFQF